MNVDLSFFPINIAKMSGKMWKNSSAAERAEYQALALEEKRVFMQLHPQYRYNPRRPNQIRRRSRTQTFNAQGSNAEAQ